MRMQFGPSCCGHPDGSCSVKRNGPLASSSARNISTANLGSTALRLVPIGILAFAQPGANAVTTGMLCRLTLPLSELFPCRRA